MSFHLRFTRRFSMAHRLISGRSELCATPHGHNEFVTVELAPRSVKKLDGSANMVVEFASAKARWHRFVDEVLDHALQLSSADPLVEIATAQFPQWRLVITPGDPTTELLAALLASKCQAIIDDEGLDLHVERLLLEETPTNTVVVDGDGRALLPTHLPTDLPTSHGWWLRADQSAR